MTASFRRRLPLLALVALVAPIALCALAPLEAHARPSATAVVHPRPGVTPAAADAMPFHLVRERRSPEGERLSAPTPRKPTCIGLDDKFPGSMTIRSRGRTLQIDLEGRGGNEVVVRERGRLLWRRDVGSTGGALATKACSATDWGVLVAGHYRHGDDVYNLFTGRKLGPGDVVAYAPDLSWGLVLPQIGWASSCYQVSRAFRVPFDGSRRPYALDTPPVPDLCNDQPHENIDAPVSAISPDGRLYAVASPVEIGLYRASDDRKIARYERPPFDAAQRRTPLTTRLAFSRSGHHLVLMRDQRAGSGPDDSTWFRIEQRSTR